jgi:nucleotide-binding universal stress UspA family protein
MQSIFHDKLIMIPIDFTPITDNALSYASSFAKIFNNKLMLMHVADKNKLAEATQKLSEKAANNQKISGVETTSTVVEGNIFDHIGQTASETAAALVVMGTHGIKGTQKLVGSHAIKVITHSAVPFIVTQSRPFEEIKNIIIPVDFSMEIKQVLIFAKEIAEQFGATIHLLSRPVSDEWLLKKVNLNLQYSKDFFEENNLNVKIIDSFTGKDFQKETVRAAVETYSSLIVILIDPDQGLVDYMMGSYEQKVIANEAGIPVMCINMKSIKSVSYSAFMTGL